ncbi:hypothetical protein HMPREF0591_1603 [Mycobacterium parascrofulaceum ATCC BAA-614]|uniref:DUF7064 domain-containing protein n=1 Tax=Mycobacterium parascrofulaceum ATCC BAA-614 TaxID=525368 RepID=D5P609_9MYCO|nr:hypothetical protein [Mycobacterium parascrofulaceum]EFG78495.1 hypothetical protein HMPREF0591_1603 [Mycobacterium parascrofulaceum ATCC BAA-614]
MRLANRPNEGRGERTVCIYLPDGSLGFGFERPHVSTNDVVAAAGFAVEVYEPFQELQVTFDDCIRVLGDSRDMTEPRAALSGALEVACRIGLCFTALASPHEQTFDADGRSFAPHHYEQLTVVRSTVTVNQRTILIDGHRLRDHSWGPRSWQAPWFCRWMHGCSNGFGFMVANFGEPDGTSRRGGFVFDDGEVHACDRVTITTVRDDDNYQRSITVLAHARQRCWRIHGEARASVPLRHRGSDGAPSTRIVESATRWRTDAGVRLHGMSEYLDQLRDGKPVGLHV